NDPDPEIINELASNSEQPVDISGEAEQSTAQEAPSSPKREESPEASAEDGDATAQGVVPSTTCEHESVTGIPILNCERHEGRTSPPLQVQTHGERQEGTIPVLQELGHGQREEPMPVPPDQDILENDWNSSSFQPQEPMSLSPEVEFISFQGDDDEEEFSAYYPWTLSEQPVDISGEAEQSTAQEAPSSPKREESPEASAEDGDATAQGVVPSTTCEHESVTGIPILNRERHEGRTHPPLQVQTHGERQEGTIPVLQELGDGQREEPMPVPPDQDILENDWNSSSFQPQEEEFISFQGDDDEE
ncbi:hypothetical protein SK128_007625, partial [Halocaridina rubra]